MIGIGRIRITRSDKMLNEALKNHRNFLSMQRISAVGDQKADTGMQLRMLLIMA